MFRLRTTATLSLAALALGALGTWWVSGMNTGWAGPVDRVAGFVAAPVSPPPARVARVVPQRLAAPTPHIVHARAPVAVFPQRTLLPAVTDVVPAVAAAPAPPELVPVSMPQTPVAWSRMQDHLHGSVLLQVTVDGEGRVTDAALARSSGDPVLDAHALASVHDWRFAVPAGYPDGFSAKLPMNYTSDDGQIAQAP